MQGQENDRKQLNRGVLRARGATVYEGEEKGLGSKRERVIGLRGQSGFQGRR